MTDSPESKNERQHAESLALVWRLASELVRRHPTKLLAVHGYYNDIYDVIDIADREQRQSLAMLNANGVSALVRGELLPWVVAFAPPARSSQLGAAV